MTGGTPMIQETTMKFRGCAPLIFSLQQDESHAIAAFKQQLGIHLSEETGLPPTVPVMGRGYTGDIMGYPQNRLKVEVLRYIER